jgi:pimeloyl-ACP methyl ester carboxylesterase
MWAIEDEGLTGITFDSDGHRLVGVLYLARGEEPKPTVLWLHGCPGLEKNLDLAVRLREGGWNALVFHYRGCWGSAGRYDLRTIPRDVTAAVDYLARCPRVLVVHGTRDRWVPVAQARELAARAGSSCRYVEVAGANHAFAWHRAELTDLIIGWLRGECCAT